MASTSIFEDLKYVFVLTVQTVLWSAGLLALAGCFRISSVELPGIEVAVILAIWVEFLVFLSSFFNRSDSTTNVPVFRYVTTPKILCRIPIFLIGLLLPIRGMFVYGGIIVGLELMRISIRSFWGAMMSGGTTAQDTDYDKNEREILGISWRKKKTDEITTQHFLRGRGGDGRERLEANTLVEFGKDQKIAVVHVPFCPVFAASPRIEAKLVSESDAEVTEIQSFPYGARIEVRRTSEKRSAFRLYLLVEEDAD